MRWPSDARSSGSAPALLSSGALGAVLLAWLVLTLFAPGLGSVIAVFGSPVFAFFVILRLLSLGPTEPGSCRARPGPSSFAADPDLLSRVAARSDGRCSECAAAAMLHLRQVLPVGRETHDLERRFVAVCDRCETARPVRREA